MKKKKSLSTIVFYTLMTLVILYVISVYLSPSIVAKYTTTGSAGDFANVAKWDISFTDGKGDRLESVIQSVHLESGDKGSWGLDIVNNSEVSAKFASSANIKLRLQSPSLDLNHHHDSWDFLHTEEEGVEKSIDNPINFKVYMYNCSLSEIETKIDEKEVLIFDTATSPLVFTMVIDDGIFYYETVVNVAEIIKDDFPLEMGDKASLKVLWSVEENSEVVDTSSLYTSYHVISVDKYNEDREFYEGLVSLSDGITLIADANITNSVITNNTISEDLEKYVIAYKEHDYFDYLIYTSSVGGEVMITLTDSLGKEYVKRSTKLNSDEITILRNRTLDNTPTLDNAKKYIEKLGYSEYLRFEETQALHDQSQGYISLGLTCRIVLDLKVEQVD